MKTRTDHLLWLIILIILPLVWSSCGKDDEPEVQIGLTGNKTIFNINENIDSGISGFMTLEEREDGSTLITVLLTGTRAGSHPNHIHENTLAQSGEIVITLTNVDGTTGLGVTEVSTEDDGSPITYSDLIEFDGHLSVHLSDSDLNTVIAAGDIGDNVFTGENDMFSLMGDGIEGNIEFQERENGETLATVTITGASDPADHPNHIHENTAVEGGSIIISLNNIDAVTGISRTDIGTFDNGTVITYEELINLNGHIVVHQSEADFSSIAKGDIGVYALTGESEEYQIEPVGNSGVSGMATLEERRNGTTLVTMKLNGTTSGIEHPNHIHLNSLSEGGSIILGFNNINGDTGEGFTNVESLNDGTTITYEELVNIDGHFKIHKSEADFSIVAEGEAGGNVLTGESVTYQITELNGSGVSGMAMFEERKNGNTLATLSLQGTFGQSHPAHIHENPTAQGGSIIIDFNNVNGTSGISITNIERKNNSDPITYQDLLIFNGHIRVHNSDADFSSVAGGDIGSNAN